MIAVSAAHKVVAVPAEPKLQGLWPQAKVVDFRGRPTMLLPHGLRETVMLRNMGLDVPAPILTQYRWPGNKRPFRVQRLTAALFTTSQRCYCLNGLGTGKTRAAIWAFDFLKSTGVAKRALVVATLSTLDNTWRKEVFQTTPHLSCGVLYGTKQHRLNVLATMPDVLIINTDGIKVLSSELLKLFEKGEIDTLIIDELALFRSAKERSKVARALASKATWAWGMTGSPTPNAPTDAWGQCRILTPHTVPKFFTRFRDDTMRKVGPFKWVPKRDAEQVVFRSMQPSVRFTLDDVTELPECITRPVDIKMGPKQEAIYEEIRKHAYAKIANREITAVNAGTVLNKLLQISLGYVYSTDRGVIPLDNTDRLDALVDAIGGTDRKVLVFVPYTHALNGVHARLEAEGIETSPIVDGSTPKGKRDHIFNLFQNTNKFKVIPAHPACMSHGLTLTAADTIIWFGPTTSNETFEQANARIRRIGQQHKQLILLMQSSPAEKKMWARLSAKQSVQDNVLELFADATADSNAE